MFSSVNREVVEGDFDLTRFLFIVVVEDLNILAILVSEDDEGIKNCDLPFLYIRHASKSFEVDR